MTAHEIIRAGLSRWELERLRAMGCDLPRIVRTSEVEDASVKFSGIVETVKTATQKKYRERTREQYLKYQATRREKRRREKL
jgi:hypothetical protein